MKNKERENLMKAMRKYRIKEFFTRTGFRWDRRSQSAENAHAYAQRHINEEPKPKLNATDYSMEYLLAHSGESINGRYRSNSATELDEQIAAMVAAHKTDTDLILYRGVCEHVFEQMIENAKGRHDCDFYEKGFLATSLVKEHELKEKIRLRIYVPAGTNAVYMGNANEEPGYYEVDIMHGAKLKIVSADSKYINCVLLGTE